MASTGGQIMPPVREPGLLMAEMIGMPYTEVMIAAILPAVLYLDNIFVIDLGRQRWTVRFTVVGAAKS